jgi:polar amino acid transport system permease protein
VKPKKLKITLLDIVVLTGMAALGGYIGYRVLAGLEYKWDWGVIPQYLFRYDAEKGRWTANLLIQGLLTTIRLSVWATILGFLLGLVLGLCRTSKRLFQQLLGRSYVEAIRNLPPLVLVFIFYYFVSDQIMPALGIESWVRGMGPSAQSIVTFLFAPPEHIAAFLSAVITLAIYEGSYITEIIRAGIQSIETGQWEASYALGLSWWQKMRHVILPQALRRSLPPLAGQFISTIKDSAIVSVISIQELTFQGMALTAATYLTFEIWITVTLMYLILTFSCSMAARRLELWLEKNSG